jgi:uncharacterized phage protein (TIGR02218 family)
MRPIPSPLAEKLSAEATTLARCWRVTRRDASVLGFTDHDDDLTFDGTTFRAAPGLDARAASAAFGLATGGGEVTGALSDEALTEHDLAAGLWDAATVECFLVDWTDVTARMRLSVGEIGEVRRSGGGFVAEVRGMAHRLAQPVGRRFTAQCDAALGDARCGVMLDVPAYAAATTVLAPAGALAVTAENLEAYEPGWFTGGTLTWTTGANTGRVAAIRDHALAGSIATLALWDAPLAEPQPVDAFVVRAGCDKRAETCRLKFANILNFRGFPMIPGSDRALGYPSSADGAHDGGSWF